MKSQMLVVFSLASAAATFSLCGCSHAVEVKTEHEIKPIHITLDVNLNVAKTLDQDLSEEKQDASDSAAAGEKDAIRQRRKARRDALNTLKAKGVVGEYSTGLLVYRVKSKELADLVKAENADRDRLFDLWAAENDVTREEIAAQYAQRCHVFALEGHYYMKEGAWHKVDAAEAAANEKIRAEKRRERQEKKAVEAAK